MTLRHSAYDSEFLLMHGFPVMDFRTSAFGLCEWFEFSTRGISFRGGPTKRSLFFLVGESTGVLPQYFRRPSNISEAFLLLAKQWSFHKIWNVVVVCTFILRASPPGGRMCA
jgi:hypothetical protein